MKPIFINGCQHYHINQDGVVLNTKTGRVLKTDLTNMGYHRVTLWSEDQKRVRISVHRLVALHYVDNTDDLPMVNHKDGVKLNNHYTNLQWCTCSENTIHAFETGLRKDTKKKVSNEVAKEIYTLWKSGESPINLRVRYKLSKHIISDILYSKKSYKNIA